MLILSRGYARGLALPVKWPRLAQKLQAHELLKLGGVLLATFPGISQIEQYEWGNWYWLFTTQSARRLFEEAFPAANLIETHGNVLAANYLLHGLAAGEMRQEELDYGDPNYGVFSTLRVVKAETAL